MPWLLWFVTLAAVNLPILTLLADRILDLAAPRAIRWSWLPSGAALVVAWIAARTVDPGLLELVGWGACGARR